jgi:quinone-modifying oxidoreductase subunit QmoB
MMDRLGVFFCSGCGIGEAIDLNALSGVAQESKVASCTTHSSLCSPEGLFLIKEAMDSGQVGGILLGACSSRAKTEGFRFDSGATAVERVSLREQVTWSHPPRHEDTQMLAEDLLRMGLVRLGKTSLTKPLQETIDATVLVVGGGIAGLEAARAAAGMGHPVVLVEAGERLGGHLADLRELVPDRPPYDAPQPNHLPGLLQEIQRQPSIRVLTKAKVCGIAGQPGQFRVEVQSNGKVENFTAGAIVQATGARPYDASKLSHLGYGDLPNVITSYEFEKMLGQGRLARPSDGRKPERILFVQCAGSRDSQHLSYCSSECCATTLKQVACVHQVSPEIETMVIYRDMRTPGQLERFYLTVQAQPGSLFTRGEVDRVEGSAQGKLAVQVRDSLLGEGLTLEADLVVLAVGMVPNAADGEAIRALHDAERRVETGESETQRAEARKQAEELAHHQGTEILNLGYRQGPDLPSLAHSFADSHFICFPYETRRTGIYAAGSLRAPMGAAQAAEDGWGAAMKAVLSIQASSRGEAVHPRSGDTAVPDFFLQRCTQCKRCTEECPFGTLNEDEKGTPQLNALRCRRCGICMGACPERIISFPDYSVDGVAGMIKSISVPEEDDEKPRILALLCENDALPALDAAAGQGKQWNSWVRVIPIRCLGSTNIVWIAEALSRGIDGLILIGCRSGDDYQCHYMRGSQLATTRLGNVQETLTRLALEPERIKVVELAHDEFSRITEVLDEFAASLEALGPNPLKGF